MIKALSTARLQLFKHLTKRIKFAAFFASNSKRLVELCKAPDRPQSTCATKQTPLSFHNAGVTSVFISIRKIK